MSNMSLLVHPRAVLRCRAALSTAATSAPGMDRVSVRAVAGSRSGSASNTRIP
jgi:hypothetical protein